LTSFANVWRLDALWERTMSSDEILTIRDVAALLKIGEKTAYTMAQDGDLPGFKVRGQWRFRHSDINAWISEQVDQARAESKEDEA
jgi:excisionase family DNA binding protein